MIEVLWIIAFAGMLLGGLFLVFWFIGSVVGTGEHTYGYIYGIEVTPKYRMKVARENRIMLTLGMTCLIIGIVTLMFIIGGR